MKHKIHCHCCTCELGHRQIDTLHTVLAVTSVVCCAFGVWGAFDLSTSSAISIARPMLFLFLSGLCAVLACLLKNGTTRDHLTTRLTRVKHGEEEDDDGRDDEEGDKKEKGQEAPDRWDHKSSALHAAAASAGLGVTSSAKTHPTVPEISASRSDPSKKSGMTQAGRDDAVHIIAATPTGHISSAPGASFSTRSVNVANLTPPSPPGPPPPHPLRIPPPPSSPAPVSLSKEILVAHS